MKKTTNSCALAADVGGTNTRMAVVTGEGEILTQSKRPTHCKKGRDEMIKFLVSFSREIFADGVIKGINFISNKKNGLYGMDDVLEFS